MMEKPQDIDSILADFRQNTRDPSWCLIVEDAYYKSDGSRCPTDCPCLNAKAVYIYDYVISYPDED